MIYHESHKPAFLGFLSQAKRPRTSWVCKFVQPLMPPWFLLPVELWVICYHCHKCIVTLIICDVSRFICLRNSQRKTSIGRQKFEIFSSHFVVLYFSFQTPFGFQDCHCANYYERIKISFNYRLPAWFTVTTCSASNNFLGCPNGLLALPALLWDTSWPPRPHKMVPSERRWSCRGRSRSKFGSSKWWWIEPESWEIDQWCVILKFCF